METGKALSFIRWDIVLPALNRTPDSGIGEGGGGQEGGEAFHIKEASLFPKGSQAVKKVLKKMKPGR